MTAEPSITLPAAPAAPPPFAASRTFPARADQVSQVRRFLAALLRPGPAAGDALLCASELAANAVLYSRSGRTGGEFSVRVSVVGHRLRVEVTDEGGPWAQRSGENSDSGRGLVIVGHLASRWDTSGDDTSRTVWFEIDEI